METMKIRIIPLVLMIPLLLLCHFSQGQPVEFNMQEIDGTEYIAPTVEILVRFLNWNMNEWEPAMIGLGYACATGKEDAHRPVYLKWKMGNMVLGI